MGYLKHVKGMLLLGQSKEAICAELGITEQVFYRWVETERKRSGLNMKQMPLKTPCGA